MLKIKKKSHNKSNLIQCYKTTKPEEIWSKYQNGVSVLQSCCYSSLSKKWYLSLFFQLTAWTPPLNLNRGSSKFENKKPLVTASLYQAPTLSPLIPLKPPDTERGCLMAPTQTPGVLWVGCLHSVILLLWPGVIWSSTLFKPVYCAWLQGRGAWVYRDTPVSLYWVSPDCMNLDRLTGDP